MRSVHRMGMFSDALFFGSDGRWPLVLPTIDMFGFRHNASNFSFKVAHSSNIDSGIKSSGMIYRNDRINKWRICPHQISSHS